MNFFDLDLEGVPVPLATHQMPRRKGTVVLANLGSIINWVLTGQLSFYSHNRGDGSLSLATIKKTAAEGVVPDIIGECTIGQWEGGMRLNNWHSRLYGFLYLHKERQLKQKDLDLPVSVRVQENFIESYTGLSVNHKTRDKIKCPELAYGGILKDVFDAVGPECIHVIGSNRWTVLSSVIYNLSQAAPRWYWPDVYRVRMEARQLANELYGAIRLSQDKRKKLAEAIQFWYNLVMTVEANSPANVSKIRSSAGFFGYVLCDQLSDKRISKNHKINANKVLRNLDKMLKICPELCRGDRADIVAHNVQLDRILKKKINSESEDAD